MIIFILTLTHFIISILACSIGYCKGFWSGADYGTDIFEKGIKYKISNPDCSSYELNEYLKSLR